jgi:hypothetical protein
MLTAMELFSQLMNNRSKANPRNYATMKFVNSFGRCLLAALIAAGLAFGLTGCSLFGICSSGDPGKPKAYNVQINLGSQLKDSSVVVDLIAANPSDLEALKTYSINKYWTPGNRMRNDAMKVSFSFVGGKETSNTLSRTNGVWKQWIGMGAQYLVVVADLPGVFDDGKVGTEDPRRQILPICKCYWPSGTKAIDVEVQPSRVRVVTAPSPGQTLPPGW